MKSVSLFIALFLLIGASLSAQGDPSKPSKAPVKPKTDVKNNAPAVRPDVIRNPNLRVLAPANDSILNIEISNRYKAQIRVADQQLQTTSRRMPANEAFDLIPMEQSFARDCWSGAGVRFKNKASELDAYLDMLRRLQEYASRPRLNDSEREAMMALYSQIRKYRAEVIQPVDKDGKRITICDVMPISDQTVLVTATPVSKATGAALPALKVYAVPVGVAPACSCPNCFSGDYTKCDFNAVNAAANPAILMNGATRIAKKTYHFFVLQETGGISKVVYRERKRISVGTSFKLKVPGM